MNKDRLNIYQSKYSSLFSDYGYGVNSLSDILHGLGYNIKNLNSPIGRLEAIDAIGQLLEKDIICVSHWGKYHDIVKELDFNLKQTLIFIDRIWFEDANYTDFFNMVSFEYTDWYYKKLKETGIDSNTDWKWFADEFVVNLEQWIQENKPKK